MNIIKAKKWTDIPDNYTGIAESEYGYKIWLKNGKLHREDGPAEIWKKDKKQFESWHLNARFIWTTSWGECNLKNSIILSKEQHPNYPTVQIWKWIGWNGVREQIMIPGMESLFLE